MCLDRETMRAGELRTASCPASSPPQVLSAELKLRRDFCSQDLPHSELPSLLSTAAPGDKEELAQPGQSQSCAWQGSPAALHLSFPLALLGAPALCGSLSAWWHISSCVLQHHLIMEGQAETRREQGSPSWQDSVLQG